MENHSYKAGIEIEPETPCQCGGCDWAGPQSELEDIGDALLTPGDPSPAGRCPIEDCQSLAYVVRPPRRFLAVIEGGILQGIYTDNVEAHGANVYVIDYDTEGACEEDILNVTVSRQTDGETIEAVGHIETIPSACIDLDELAAEFERREERRAGIDRFREHRAKGVIQGEPLHFENVGLCYWKPVDFRSPKAGEFYLSGAEVTGYRANQDLDAPFHIVIPTHYARLVKHKPIFGYGNRVKV